MIEVINVIDMPFQLWQTASKDVMRRTGAWFVIVDGRIYNRWNHKENADDEAQGLASYFS